MMLLFEKTTFKGKLTDHLSPFFESYEDTCVTDPGFVYILNADTNPSSFSQIQ